MRRIITYKLTLGEAALVILDDIVTGTLATFYPHPYYHTFCSHAHRRSFYNALKRLERTYLVGRKGRRRGEQWYLTPEGEQVVRRLRVKLVYARKRRWDGKWRLVIFDVPERIRGRRDFLRKELVAMGFHQLQKSVWVTPYPLPDDFFDIMDELELGKHFRIVTADGIRDDGDLRTVFFPKE